MTRIPSLALQTLGIECLTNVIMEMGFYKLVLNEDMEREFINRGNTWVPGKVLGIVGQDPCDSKPNRLHVDIFRCCLHSFEVYSSLDSSRMIRYSPKVPNFNRSFLKLNRCMCNKPPVLPKQWNTLMISISNHVVWHGHKVKVPKLFGNEPLGAETPTLVGGGGPS